MRAVSASSPDTGTTAWQMPVLSISVVNRVATSLADIIASMRPAPISSARDATPMTPSAPADPPTSSPICLQQRDIGGVERAQQEHHRVDARHPVLGHQQPQRALGDVAGQRRCAWRVDDRGVDQFGGRPLDVQVGDVGGIQRAEIEGQAAVTGVTGDRHVGAPPAVVVGGHLRRRAVPEPGDDPGGLGGVGGGDVLPHQRVDQRRLAGLERAGQRDADRLVELPADAVQFVEHVRPLLVGGFALVGADGSAQDGAHLIARAH